MRVSLTDLDLPGGNVPSEDFGRTPPQDIAAEQSVLGGMLLSKDAIADVVEVLRGNDFYRPANESVFEAILDLYGRGEPADAVTVAAELTKRGEIGRVGGAAYLHTLLSSVPTAANAGFYARIVRERAILRRLVQAGTKIVQLGYATDGGDVEEIVNAAQAEVYQVSERRQTEDFLPIADTIESTIDEIEAASHRTDGLIGVPTGFADLDRLTNGLHPGQMIVIAARPAVGKALALSTPIPTPTGWTTMGELAVGDHVLGADGRPTRVTAAFEVRQDRPCYEVHFCDGEVVIADAEHLWLTTTRAARRAQGGQAQVVTTETIAASVRCGTANAHLNHSIANAQAWELPWRDLPVPAYTLGAELGRRSGSGPQQEWDPDPQVELRIELAGLDDVHSDQPIATRLVGIGVLDHPHLPAAYVRASLGQRRALLAGLLDTAGTVASNGSVLVRLSSPRLADDVRELIATLGHRSERSSTATGLASPEVTITFSTDEQVFGIERKAVLHKQRSVRAPRPRDARFITEVRPIDSVPVRCIAVDNADHLYLAGRTMIATHNSTVGLDICRSAAIHHNMPAVVFSLEMSRTEITMRLLSAEARIPLQNMRKGTMREEDWTRLARTMGTVSEAPLFIDDSPNMSLMEIRAKCRRLKQKHGLRLVVLDYLQLMTSGKKVESRQQEVSEFSRALKLLAKELEVPVIAISQLNRGPEQRTDKKPMVSDLRESGSIEQDADMVILLHREDMYEKESPRAGEADFIVAKHRNGPTDTITVAFQGHYSRFVDMAT